VVKRAAIDAQQYRRFSEDEV
jgi:hypothetical protein